MAENKKSTVIHTLERAHEIRRDKSFARQTPAET